MSHTENWRRYAAWELVRQAVADLRRGGDITGVTTEKMKKLFPEIKSGWEASSEPSAHKAVNNHEALVEFAEYVLEMDPKSDAPLFARARAALSAAK